jgi:predicted dehydrogenase
MVVGSEPIAAQAAARWADRDSVARSDDLLQKPDAGSVDATIAGLLEFPRGTLAQIEASFRTSFHQSLVIIGTEGAITVKEPFVNGDQPVELELSVGDNRDLIRVPGADKYALMVEAFAEAALRGEQAPYSPEDSLKQMKVLDALDAGARRGCRIEI